MSLRSLLACATIWGFRPSPLFCLRVAGENGARPLFLIGWCVDTRSTRRGGLSCAGVGGFEVLMLRCGGMTAPRVLMGC